MSQLVINEKYKDLVPPLTDEEYSELKQSIKEKGLWVPIIINSQNVVLDGHHRFKICGELGIEPKTTIKDFENENYEALFVIDCNLKRRHLNSFQRTELALKSRPYLEGIVKIHESLGGKGSKILEPLPKKGISEEIGKRSGVSHETVRKVETILEKAPEKLKENVRKGKTSIDYAFKSVRRAEDHKETPKLPQGQFDIVYADPPWKFDINIRGSPDEHYAVMTDQDIKDLQVPTADNAILFLWSTNAKLPEALEVMKSWGFKYKTNAVWVKNNIAMGFYVRGQHELLLIGEKGDMPVPEERNRPSSVIQAGNTKHSTKPPLVYTLIEQMYPNRKYLELFARSQFSSKWTVWGNEVKQNSA